MELTIRTTTKQQEKYLIAFLKSVDIEYVQAKKEIKPKGKKNGDVMQIVAELKGTLKGFNPKGDAKAEHILNKHK